MVIEASRLQGVFPPVPTPFDAEGEIAPDHLKSNIKKLSQTALSGFIILGSNGEYVYLDESEKLQLCEAARSATPADRLLVAGTGAESTRATLRLTQRVAQLGADAAIIITPAYYKSAMTPKALKQHFQTIAEASPIPIILYNMPANTGLDMTTDTVLELAAHPNIIGLKESGGNIVKIAEIVRGVNERKLDFSVLAGSASFLLGTLAVGGQGGVVASANVAPELCLEIYKQRTAQTQQRVLALNAAVTTRYGVAGLKYVMEQRGLYGGPVRAPLLPVTSEDRAVLDQILTATFEGHNAE